MASTILSLEEKDHRYMCGIAGFISKNTNRGDSSNIIQSMIDALNHRGPDDEGTFVLGYEEIECALALGHKRLSIIDLSKNASQPMIDTEDDFVIIFNGEIYNYLELKNELIGLGYSFDTTSDTEVALNSYRQWGAKCFERFNGMWSIAIYDKKNRYLTLSRDRLGKKPLFYCKTESSFIFASEIKSILKYKNISIKPNFKKVYRYLSGSYRYIDCDNESYFENVFSVPKGSYVKVDLELRIETSKYWELTNNKCDFSNKTEADIIDEFKTLFIDSVKLRLRSDVPVGCMLSGGMDSTSITSVAYKILKTPIVTFSGITGGEKGVYDESEYIDEIVKDTNANHHYIRPDPTDLFETLQEMLYFHDEPVCTVSWYSLYLIAKKIKNDNIKVVLNGHGGDELLAGYWYHYPQFFYDLDKNKDTDRLNYEISKWRSNHGRELQEIENTKNFINHFYTGLKSESSRYGDYSCCFAHDFKNSFQNTISFTTPFDDTSYLSRTMYNELLYETVPASLKAEDRNTMANSIESRSPMLDYRLAEFCFSLPNNFKIRDGIGKWILRESMEGILPEKVRKRKDKAGFLAPADAWFRTTNKDQIRELINCESIKNTGIFNIDNLNEIFDEHLDNKNNHQMFLWQFINFGLWYKKFFTTGEKQ